MFSLYALRSVVIHFRILPSLLALVQSDDKPPAFARVTFLEHIMNTEFANNELRDFRNQRVWFLDTRTFLLMLLTSNDVSNTIFKNHIENGSVKKINKKVEFNLQYQKYRPQVT
jgi:hypothetical protein